MQRFQGSPRSVLSTLLLVLVMGLLLYPGLKNIAVYLFSAITGNYISGTHSVVFLSCPNEQVGKVIARYNWDSEITETTEVLMVLKTRTSKIHRLTEFIRSVHPFEVPEVISILVDQGNPLYFKWIEETVPED
ncbi:protein CutA homolog isoform X3 [Stegostoma tigrinum]|uniref:protein CutA homolog isoform X3 n=1 Tax=Stegostoma tigrinum TaxID=3053191 RepID=UPI00202B8427|nr:protein CutA homolog isoform X3 [Stegostoma tigrinum]